MKVVLVAADCLGFSSNFGARSGYSHDRTKFRVYGFAPRAEAAFFASSPWSQIAWVDQVIQPKTREDLSPAFCLAYHATRMHMELPHDSSIIIISSKQEVYAELSESMREDKRRKVSFYKVTSNDSLHKTLDKVLEWEQAPPGMSSSPVDGFTPSLCDESGINERRLESMVFDLSDSSHESSCVSSLFVPTLPPPPLESLSLLTSAPPATTKYPEGTSLAPRPDPLSLDTPTAGHLSPPLATPLMGSASASTASSAVSRRDAEPSTSPISSLTMPPPPPPGLGNTFQSGVFQSGAIFQSPPAVDALESNWGGTVMVGGGGRGDVSMGVGERMVVPKEPELKATAAEWKPPITPPFSNDQTPWEQPGRWEPQGQHQGQQWERAASSTTQLASAPAAAPVEAQQREMGLGVRWDRDRLEEMEATREVQALLEGGDSFYRPAGGSRYSCHVCQASVTDFAGLVQHHMGRRHKNKQRIFGTSMPPGAGAGGGGATPDDGAGARSGSGSGRPIMGAVMSSAAEGSDALSTLQMLFQLKKIGELKFEKTGRGGLEHAPRFKVACKVGGELIAEEEAGSVKAARRLAAFEALKRLRERGLVV